MQTKGKLLSAAGMLAASVMAFSAHAQYVGPFEGPAAKVSSILENPRDDQDVMLQGRLLRKIGNEKYLFSDGSGEIVVEIDDEDFPREAVDEHTVVELQGEVDTGRNRPPEVEVDAMRIVK